MNTEKTTTAKKSTPEWDETTRRAMLAGGILFILTFVTSIPGLLLYGPILDNSDYVLTAGHDTQVTFGALLELGLVIANIGTAIAFFPILKRHSESIALSYVASRIFESIVIAVGIISVLSVVTLRQDIGGPNAADPNTLVTIASSLIAIHDWTFLFGPAFCAGFGNGILLGYLMYKSGLMPRRLAIIGLIGGPIALATAVAVLFGAYEQVSSISFLLTIPEIVWELSVGFYLTVKGIQLGRARSRSGSGYGAQATAASQA